MSPSPLTPLERELRIQLVEQMLTERPGLFKGIATLLAAGVAPESLLHRIEADGATPFVLNWCAVVINHLAETMVAQEDKSLNHRRVNYKR